MITLTRGGTAAEPTRLASPGDARRPRLGPRAAKRARRPQLGGAGADAARLRGAGGGRPAVLHRPRRLPVGPGAPHAARPRAPDAPLPPRPAHGQRDLLPPRLRRRT